MNESDVPVEEAAHVVIAKEAIAVVMPVRAKKVVLQASLLPAFEAALVVVVALLHLRRWTSMGFFTFQ